MLCLSNIIGCFKPIASIKEADNCSISCSFLFWKSFLFTSSSSQSPSFSTSPSSLSLSPAAFPLLFFANREKKSAVGLKNHSYQKVVNRHCFLQTSLPLTHQQDRLFRTHQIDTSAGVPLE